MNLADPLPIDFSGFRYLTVLFISDFALISRLYTEIRRHVLEDDIGSRLDDRSGREANSSSIVSTFLISECNNILCEVYDDRSSLDYYLTLMLDGISVPCRISLSIPSNSC